jgi:two-component system cell cycle sensor histidine kinase/response regulator CckA
MPAGGDIRVEAENAAHCPEWPTTEARTIPDVVRIRVSDTGKGIEKEKLSRVFQPFFTEDAEHGCGLGLCNVRETMDALGGHVLIASEVGKGTTVTLLFPAAEPTMEQGKRAERVRQPLTVPRGGHLLLVEHEGDVREGIRRVLEGEGYLVRAFATVQEAEATRETAGEPDLVVLDAGMGEESLESTILRIRGGRPHLPLLILSGYPESEVLPERIPGEVEILAKPFMAGQLLQQIEQIVGPGG